MVVALQAKGMPSGQPQLDCGGLSTCFWGDLLQDGGPLMDVFVATI